MRQACDTEIPPVLRTPPVAGRVLFALNANEWNLFFPTGLGALPYTIKKLPHENSSALFRDELLCFEPDVLVTSWSTPPLPRPLLGEERTIPRYICHTTGSVKYQVPREFIERGGRLTNWGDLAGKTVAEHALLLILSGLRRVPEWQEVIAGKRRWQPSPVITKTLYGKKVGIHGFGNVARSLVALLEPFGVIISAWSDGVPEQHFRQHRVRRAGGLIDLIETSEIFVECEALTPATKGILNKELLAKFCEGTLFVNVGRGLVVDEAALSQFAMHGTIDVALDVYVTDPISPDSLLHKVPTAVLSPHIAGPTNDQFPMCGQRVLANISAFFENQPLVGEVTLEIYDRAT